MQENKHGGGGGGGGSERARHTRELASKTIPLPNVLDNASRSCKTTKDLIPDFLKSFKFNFSV